MTVLERQDRILARVTTAEMSAYFNELHTQNGVQIHTSKQVESITNTNGINEILCANGSVFNAEMIIIGVGVRINSELAESIGLEIENGIKVDETVRTSDEHIYAIGDCTSHFNPHFGRFIRLESVQNAVDQAKVAASAICGNKITYNSIPWFWSDQFDVKFQMVGLSTGYTEVLLRKEEDLKLSAWYFNNEELLAVDAVKNAKAYVLGTKIIKDNLNVNKAVLMDIDTVLKLDLLTI